MKKILLCMALYWLFSSTSFATGQAPDVLIYDNKIYRLFSNPLESYYKNEKDRPAFKISPDVMSSTGNWRGYVATWEIDEDILYLRGIDAWICNFKEYVTNRCRKADLKELFGERCIKGRVEAAWFSGELRLPDGKQLEYVHMGYGSVYERDIVLNVESGKVVNRTVIDNTQKKQPSNLELQRQELEKLKKSPTGKIKNLKPIERR